MRTVFDVKKALDQDTMYNILLEAQKERKVQERVTAKRERKRKTRTRWDEAFPICVCW